MKRYRGFDIQQKNANRYNVIRTDSNGVRRSYYEADSVADAKRWILENCTIIRFDRREFKSGYNAGLYARKITTLYENGDGERAFDDALNCELDCLTSESQNIDRDVIDSFIIGFGD